MWAETKTDWLDLLSKIWPVLLSIVGGISYVVGTRVRARVNDSEQAAVTDSVEKLEKIIENLVEQKTRTQEHITSITDKLNDICDDIKEIRANIARNSESIAALQGRLSRHKGEAPAW